MFRAIFLFSLSRLGLGRCSDIIFSFPLLTYNYRVTEQPYKIPFYATLLRILYNPSELSVPDESPLGRLILEDFWKGFQSYLDKVAWRDTRLCVRFLFIRGNIMH